MQVEVPGANQGGPASVGCLFVFTRRFRRDIATTVDAISTTRLTCTRYFVYANMYQV